MFRYRRYRVFLVFAVFVLFAFYKFSNSGTSWSAIERVRPDAGKGEGKKDSTRVEWQPNPQVAQDKNKLELDIPAAKSPLPEQTPPPPVKPVSRPVDEKPATRRPLGDVEPTPAVEGGLPNGGLNPVPNLEETDLETTPAEVIHWAKPSQHFPVPTESLIKLPTAKPKPIPKIQFDFKPESASEKTDREHKLNVIRSVAKRTWDGYRKHAWLQDELMPTSGGFKNPFAGWGATLVDSLDTLWIMGLKEDFVEAAKAVDQIDFTTTTRADIPLFETTIRYMGGLLAAYDVSGKEYKNLLSKAEELAEVLISAFDTPNRMPETYYYWRPDFSLNPHRAGNRAVLAEIGSLSMEFTRLAQLTGKDKYYDAIARITDKLEEFQNKTRLPGMWPTYIDISGCRRSDYSSTYNHQKPIVKEPGGGSPATSSTKIPSIPPPRGGSVQESKPLSEDPMWAMEADKPMEKAKPQEDPREDKTAPMVKPASGSPTLPGEKLSPEGHRYVPLNIPSPLLVRPEPPKKAPSIRKRQFSETDDEEEKPVPFKTVPTPTTDKGDNDEADRADPVETRPVCEEMGFASTSEYIDEEYTLGGMSDSTYEYLPKQYLLLGGVEEKYRKMYEASMNTIKENLIFRPMLPDNNDILIAGKLLVPSSRTASSSTGNQLVPQQEHLTCFAGGMIGMAAKIFDRPEDLDIAIKITEGCVWSYNMTATGIMPEGFEVIPCESMEKCEWNVTKYWDTLDPYAATRAENYKEAIEAYNAQFKVASAQYEQDLKAMVDEVEETPSAKPTPIDNGLGAFEAIAKPTPLAAAIGATSNALANPHASQNEKRQLGGLDDDTPPSEERNKAIGGHLGNAAAPANPPPTKITPPVDVDVGDATSPLPSPSKHSPIFPAIYSPKVPATHKQFVKHRILEERLPPGVTGISGRNYILRPEAIESVWYMYRITGNAYWREAGWEMFEAVSSATVTEWGNSAVEDVTAEAPVLRDEMESFWMAETLKYFYLLFAEESVLSLDEWVLNTEAHPFRRPT
ncbi:seven-hairpin glycosidase [Byssothecium circinans]|uniref:alpha-1,2-Mannosidase n=1 Tax=Byssothecium circinans TaxID=147558 RepID=A0A6A5TYV4_9PLEO|nr:seven-hairpin glycosidase [Byssothecium circinans]